MTTRTWEAARTLRSLGRRKGQELIDGVLALVDRIRPLHLSIVGGDPLVRYRELETMVPLLLVRGIHVQVVTSAFRPLAAIGPSAAFERRGFDRRTAARARHPASARNLRSDHQEHRRQNITIHCTITGQMMKRPDYLREFLEFWTPRPEIRKIWFSLFTPQRGDQLPEMLQPRERAQAHCGHVGAAKGISQAGHAGGPDPSVCDAALDPQDCVFALTTQTLSADFKTKIVPCQFGGDPDCGSCGCIASMGLAAVAAHRLAGIIPVGAIFKALSRSARRGRNAPLLAHG